MHKCHECGCALLHKEFAPEERAMLNELYDGETLV